MKDKDVWESYKRGVRPAKKTAAAAAAEAAQTVPKRKKAEMPRVVAPITALAPAPHMFELLERRREKRMREGDVEIEATLDLHGMRQQEAFHALAGFVHKNTRAGKRHLLIITGKGRGGDGVLRKNLKAWLMQLPESGNILALRQAAAQHGGDGAFYIILRKKSGMPC